MWNHSDEPPVLKKRHMQRGPSTSKREDRSMVKSTWCYKKENTEAHAHTKTFCFAHCSTKQGIHWWCCLPCSLIPLIVLLCCHSPPFHGMLWFNIFRESSVGEGTHPCNAYFCLLKNGKTNNVRLPLYVNHSRCILE